jgi:solute carrier family 25 S-adenosylmethionine transporter 26
LQIGKHDGSMFKAIKEIYSHKGIKGFYVGYFSLIMREIPFSSIQFPFYEVLKLAQIKIASKRSGIPESEV